MKLKKILTSIFTVGVVGTIAYIGYTGAFFSDKETSTGNVLVAGALDLKIDNTCYYNGHACVLVPESSPAAYEWEGGEFDGEPCSCTWESKDLGQGDVFFALQDLKPGDWEEDTISIDVDNPSWLCAEISNVSDIDNTCTEPETTDEFGDGGKVCAPPNDGELAENLFFYFWEDDGDNVWECKEPENLESCEKILTRGPASDVLGGKKWALADFSTGGVPIGPETYYIGKYFCFGTIGLNPVIEDTANPNSDPTVNSGFTCNGKLVDNQPQTDILSGDISFYAEQARHNDKFLCNPEGTLPPIIPAP